MAGHSGDYDAVIVGSGPNGLAAAITLARAGRSVLVVEARDRIGGGSRSAELTLPGFTHDLCSAIHPLGLASPFFRRLPLQDFGLEWVLPPVSLAHPLENGRAAILDRSIELTAEHLGPDGRAYRALMEPVVRDWEGIIEDTLGPLPLPPRHLAATAGFVLRAAMPAAWFARLRFRGQAARGMFAGLAGHAMLPLDNLVTSGFGLMLGMLGHTVGWPLACGGSQKIVDALGAYLRSLGGEILTGWQVESLDELPDASAVLLDVTPRQLARIAAKRLPGRYLASLQRFRYGPGVFKMDFALSQPVPWKAPECARTATLHLGGTFEEIAAAEREVWRGQHPERPFVLLAQQSLFDPQRAPQGKHTLWAYCHVPNGSTLDMSERIIAQIERFAPGFRETIMAVSTHNSQEMQTYNPNYIGGDINGGVQDIWQFFTRPTISLVPYATPVRGIYLCSSSTPPGGGVHGMCGYHAARAVLHRELR